MGKRRKRERERDAFCGGAVAWGLRMKWKREGFGERYEKGMIWIERDRE